MSMALMNAFHELDTAETDADNYFAAQVYSTAADLTDGILKGGAPTGPLSLRNALARNRDRAGIREDEKDAWDFAVQLVEDHFGDKLA